MKEDLSRAKLLESIGFTQIEALVYLNLLKSPKISGYKIAGNIKKSRANTYQAIKTLVGKGAIMQLEGGRTQKYIPLPIEQLLELKEQDFERKKTEIREAFRDIKEAEEDDFIYRFNSSDQLYQKAEQLIEGASGIILVDSAKGPLTRLKTSLEKAASGGVVVLVETTSDLKLKGCVNVKFGGLIGDVNPWDRVDWLALSADSQKTLIAYLKEDGSLITGNWISNLYLSNWFANGMMYEILVRYITNQFGQEKTKNEIWNAIEDFYKDYMKKTEGDRRLKAILKQYSE